MNDRGKGVQMATDIVCGPNMFYKFLNLLNLTFLFIFLYLCRRLREIGVMTNTGNRQAETGTTLAKHALSSVAQSKPTRSSRVSTSTPHSLEFAY